MSCRRASRALLLAVCVIPTIGVRLRTYSSVRMATTLPICDAGSSGYACRYQAALRFITGVFPNRSLYPRERSYQPTDQICTELWIEKYKTELTPHREAMTEEASRAKVLDDKVVASFKEFEQVRVDTQAFNMLYASEQAAIPARTEKAQDELRKVETCEAQLQAEYQELLECKNALATEIGAEQDFQQK